MNELRPCTVHIPEETERYRNFGEEEIITKVVRKAETRNGYFHKWSDRYWTIGASPMVGGYSAGQMSETVAIVEYEDGTVHEHLPHEIQFTDRETHNGRKRE